VPDAGIQRHLAACAAVTADLDAAAAVARRASQVLRPAGALAALDAVAVWLAAWQRRTDPGVERAAAVVFVGDHGVARHGVSAYPATVTSQMLDTLRRGQATAAVLAGVADAELRVLDVGAGRPTGDLSVEDALDTARFAEAWHAGIDAVASLDADLLVLGEMGIGNSTAAAAVTAAVLGGGPDRWCGRGTGVDDEGLERKRRVVAQGLARVGERPAPLEALRRLGGAELVAMAGAAAEARRRSLPVLLDGFITTAAVAPLACQHDGFLDHTWAGHRSAEPGHGALLARLGKVPLLDLGLRLGEGSGALVAVPIIRAAAAAVVDVATFAEAGVAGPADRSPAGT
jgi:nicotinate-nucleotide--dimethylbenzimidazole phosphoribosyltransferase